MRKLLGDYRLEDFGFEFRGGQEAGEVSVTHKGKRLPDDLRVIREGSVWKVDEN